MIKIKQIQSFILLSSLVALPSLLSADNPLSSSHQHQDLLEIKHDLQSLEAEVTQLVNELATLRAQKNRSVEQNIGHLPRGNVANNLELAIQTLLKDVTEQ